MSRIPLEQMTPKQLNAKIIKLRSKLRAVKRGHFAQSYPGMKVDLEKELKEAELICKGRESQKNRASPMDCQCRHWADSDLRLQLLGNGHHRKCGMYEADPAVYGLLVKVADALFGMGMAGSLYLEVMKRIGRDPKEHINAVPTASRVSDAEQAWMEDKADGFLDSKEPHP